MSETCAGCKFWVRFPADYKGSLIATLKTPLESEELRQPEQHGQCRRNPPRVTERSVQTGKRTTMALTISEFPDTPETAWCGEWNARA